MRSAIIAVILSATLAACATPRLPEAQSIRGQAPALFDRASSSAYVVAYKPAGSAGGWVDHRIRLNDEPPVQIREQEAIVWQVQPGIHRLRYDMWLNGDQTRLEVGEGQRALAEITGSGQIAVKNWVADRDKVENTKVARFIDVSSQAAPEPLVARSGVPEPSVDTPPTTLSVSFPQARPRPDDVAVIIGISRYGGQAKDIPPIPPAANDAAAMKRYASEALGIGEDNVIFVPNATGSQLAEVFGTERDHRGKLFNWTKAGRSRVFVYYSGHGAPAGSDGRAVLVPSDASASQLSLSGYPLDLLYANLAKVPAESVSVVLEACFSGISPAGTVVPNASPVNIKAKIPQVPANMTVITAGAADQMASWEQDRSHGLFTKHFLLGQGGEADKAPYGNGDGTVGLDELRRYLDDKVTYLARRYYGREQNVQIVKGAAR